MTTLGIALALACAAMANLSMLFKHRGACEAPESPGYSVAAMISFESVTIGAGFALFASGILRRGTICHGVVLGLSSCLLIGVSNVAIKALTEAMHASGTAALLSPWTLVAVIGGLG